MPLFIKLPDTTQGKVITDRVSSIDMMPTVLDLLDVQVPEAAQKQLRGHSLVPALRGERVQRDVFSETDYRAYTYKRSILTPDGWKLIYTLEKQRRELYNLKADPAETKNLALGERQRADELEQRLFAHFKAIGHDLALRTLGSGDEPGIQFARQGRS